MVVSFCYRQPNGRFIRDNFVDDKNNLQRTKRADIVFLAGNGLLSLFVKVLRLFVAQFGKSGNYVFCNFGRRTLCVDALLILNF